MTVVRNVKNTIWITVKNAPWSAMSVQKYVKKWQHNDFLDDYGL